ncbi:MAG: TolC family protein, partial [Candidatus Sulfotelmatobacter sp.]
MKKSPSLPMCAIIAGILASIIMTGCAVGPNYQRPVVQTPTAYRDLREDKQTQAQVASFADLPWWQVFQDPQLQELLRTALKENYDLQLAMERITAARAQVAITRSRLFPQVQGDANFNGGKDGSTRSKFNILGFT